MAVVWAKSNGNWSDTTLWAFWNENTQQIEDYGQVPQADDVVHLDGHNVSLGNSANITVSKISTNTNSFTTLGGGQLIITGGTITITADIDIYFNTASFFSLTSSTPTIIINGNIQQFDSTDGIFGFNATYVACKTIINGNLLIDSGILRKKTGSAATGFNITINGNFVSNSTSLLIQSPYGNQNMQSAYLFNGNVTLNSALMNDDTTTPNYVISGWLTVSAYQNKRGFSVNKIKYSGKFPLILYYINCDETFECIQIEYPNPNHYLIVNPNTIADTYPTEDEVLAPTQYGAQMELVGTYTPDYPPESVVLKDYEYGDSDDRKTGTMEQEVNVEVGCVTKEDVREGVELIGMGEVGTLVVPDVDDVRECVVFDNGSVGTLIVEGGGERLRIADFGYYTNAQSDTYIVDLTEQDKPKFAVAEERVLIEMFPDLDFDNIPDKYFDDLFVKYLKYRLIVEYYRTAGINSTFTPSEPTTEIVNYRNVNCEIWMNIANTYLKAWGEKYPNSIKKQRILL